jgi:hypothetical protein
MHMLDFITAPFKAVGEFILWGFIIYAAVQTMQVIGFIVRGYYMLKFMRSVTSLVSDLAREVADMRRQLPRDIARAEDMLQRRPTASPPPPIGVSIRKANDSHSNDMLSKR